MVSMKNLLKGVGYAFIAISIIVNIILSFAYIRTKSERDDISGDYSRIEAEYREYLEHFEHTMASVDRLEGTLETITEGIRSVSEGVKVLEDRSRISADGNLEVELTSDRNQRLLNELGKRLSEGTETK